MAKKNFCVAIERPVFDGRDAITGSRMTNIKCFTSERKAKKAYAKLAKALPPNEGFADDASPAFCRKTPTGHLQCGRPRQSRKNQRNRDRWRSKELPF